MFCNIFSNAGTQTEDITTMRPLSVMSGGEQSTPYKTSGSRVTVSSSPGNKVIITFESLVYLNYFIYYVFFVKSVCSDALNTNYIWYEIKIKSMRIRRVTARQFAIVFQVCEVLYFYRIFRVSFAFSACKISINFVYIICILMQI